MNRTVFLVAPNKTAMYGLKYIADSLLRKNISVIVLAGPLVEKDDKYDFIYLLPSWSKYFEIIMSIISNSFGIFFNFFKFHRFKIRDRFVFEKMCFRVLNYFVSTKILTLFNEKKPDRVYCYGDRHELLEYPVVSIAEHEGVDVVIPPLAFHADRNALANASHRVRNFKYQKSPCSVYFKDITTNLVFSTEAQDFVSFYPLWMILDSSFKSNVSANPWVIGGSGKVITHVDGQLAKSRLIASGVPCSLVRVSGNAEHDLLYNNYCSKDVLRAEFFKEYLLSPESKLIVFAVPQYYEHHFCSKKVQADFCRTVAKILSEIKEASVFVSLHPKMDHEFYRQIFEGFEFIIDIMPLNRILPLSDVFVVGEGSATALWSILCEVPIVGLHFFSWANSGVTSIPNYLRVTDLKYLGDSVQCALSDLHRATAQQENKDYKAGLSPFDGNSIDRLCFFEGSNV